MAGSLQVSCHAGGDRLAGLARQSVPLRERPGARG